MVNIVEMRLFVIFPTTVDCNYGLSPWVIWCVKYPLMASSKATAPRSKKGILKCPFFSPSKRWVAVEDFSYIWVGPLPWCHFLAKIDDARHSAQKLANFVCVLLFWVGWEEWPIVRLKSKNTASCEYIEDSSNTTIRQDVVFMVVFAE